VKRAIIAVAALVAVVTLVCCSQLATLAPFPCSTDGQLCPSGYACEPVRQRCVPESSVTPPLCGGPKRTECPMPMQYQCVLGTCVFQCAGECGPQQLCATDGVSGKAGCFIDCAHATCPQNMTCVTASSGGGKVCVWAPTDGGVSVITVNGGGSYYDLAPPYAQPSQVSGAATAASGALSSDGSSTIVWSESTAVAPWLGQSALMRLSASDGAPVQLASLASDGIVATVISGNNVYFTTGGGQDYTMGTVSMVPIAGGGTITHLVTKQPIVVGGYNSDLQAWFIQADASSLYWTTQSDSSMPIGTVASAPLGGGNAMTLAMALPQPSGLLRAGGRTIYATLGTAGNNFSDGRLNVIGSNTPLDSGKIGGVISDGAGGLLYIKGQSVMSLPANSSQPQALFTGNDALCLSSPCPQSIVKSGSTGKVLFVGLRKRDTSMQTSETTLLYGVDGTVIAELATDDQDPTVAGAPVYADNWLYWIANQSLYRLRSP
jgi:hypothetical protein